MRQLMTPWVLQLGRRFATLWYVKALGTTTFMAIFFWCYFSALAGSHHTVLEMPLIWLDHQIPFTPSAYGIYISLWVYVSLPPAFLGNFRVLLKFGGWVTVLCALGLITFWLLPSKTPIFDIDWTLYPQLALIKSLDASGNACPSMHVATAVFSAFWIDAILAASTAPRSLRLISVLHCIAIIWSTIAIRQHVAIDVIVGALLGVVFALLSLKSNRAYV
jgi:membrane-associated phospholipid phosphatase